MRTVQRLVREKSDNEDGIRKTGAKHDTVKHNPPRKMMIDEVMS